MKKKPLLIALAALLFFVLAGIGGYLYLTSNKDASTESAPQPTVVASNLSTSQAAPLLKYIGATCFGSESDECMAAAKSYLVDGKSSTTLCGQKTGAAQTACKRGVMAATNIKKIATPAIIEKCGEPLGQIDLSKLKSTSLNDMPQGFIDCAKKNAGTAATSALNSAIKTGTEAAATAKAADSTCKKLSSAKEKACVAGYFGQAAGKKKSEVCSGKEKSSCEKGFDAAAKDAKDAKKKADAAAAKAAAAIECDQKGIKVSNAWVGIPGVTEMPDGRGCIGSKTTNPTVALVGIIISLATGAIGLIMVLMIVISGLEYTLAGPDVDKAKSARNRLESTATAFVLLIIMWAVIQFILPPGAKIWS